jgi:hypothetical protein
MDRLEKWRWTKEMTIKNRLRKRTLEQKKERADAQPVGRAHLMEALSFRAMSWIQHTN